MEYIPQCEAVVEDRKKALVVGKSNYVCIHYVAWTPNEQMYVYQLFILKLHACVLPVLIIVADINKAACTEKHCFYLFLIPALGLWSPGSVNQLESERRVYISYCLLFSSSSTLSLLFTFGSCTVFKEIELLMLSENAHQMWKKKSNHG